jgi:hypothetical protein
VRQACSQRSAGPMGKRLEGSQAERASEPDLLAEHAKKNDGGSQDQPRSVTRPMDHQGDHHERGREHIGSPGDPGDRFGEPWKPAPREPERERHARGDTVAAQQQVQQHRVDRVEQQVRQVKAGRVGAMHPVVERQAENRQGPIVDAQVASGHVAPERAPEVAGQRLDRRDGGRFEDKVPVIPDEGSVERADVDEHHQQHEQDRGPWSEEWIRICHTLLVSPGAVRACRPGRRCGRWCL